jgi:hypothetical protein
MIIVAITIVAMALPLAAVAWMIKDYLSVPKSEPPVACLVNSKPLEAALEHAARTQLGGDGNPLGGQERTTLRVPAAEISGRMAQVEELINEAGGISLDGGPAAGSKGRRLRVQVPSGRYDAVVLAIQGGKVDFATIPAGQGTRMGEVILEEAP